MKTPRTSLVVVSTLSIVAGLAAFEVPPARAQGCVASRLNAPSSFFHKCGHATLKLKGSDASTRDRIQRQNWLSQKG